MIDASYVDHRRRTSEEKKTELCSGDQGCMEMMTNNVRAGGAQLYPSEHHRVRNTESARTEPVLCCNQCPHDEPFRNESIVEEGP